MAAIVPLDPQQLARERYADVEALLVAWIEQAMSAWDVRAATEIPEGDSLLDLLGACGGFIHVEAIGGSDAGLTPEKEAVTVSVDTFRGPLDDGNADPVGAADLAALLRAALLFHLPGYTTDDGATVQAVATFSRPSARPYDDATNIARRSAAYQVTVATRG